MDQSITLHDLEAISQRLGVSVGNLKRRISLLKLEPTERGSRGKLLFDDRAMALLESADALMREGSGMNTVRRKLGITLAPETEDHDHYSSESDLVSDDSHAAGQRELLAAIRSLTGSIHEAHQLLADRDQKLIETMTELRRVSETAAAMAERASNLGHQNQTLNAQVAELKMLAAPPSEPVAKKPFWKLW